MAPTPASQELASKERSLFTQVVRHYENKQYKKGLKTADQILRKKPDHGDTIAMKALIINGQGNSEEAFALAKVALQKSMKSHVCWHVYGLLYRADKNYEEAIKAYKFALKLEPESHQIQKDLAVLQIQMRDYPGYVQTRRTILQNKTLWRQNWTALAIAQHLNGDLWDAERTLITYEETLRSSPPRTDIEHAEAVLYKNIIIAEMGETERALDHLDAAARDNLDRGWVMEKRADYLLKLGRLPEAEKAYKALLDRNPEYRSYYEGLIAAKEIKASDHAALQELYAAYAIENPRNDAPRRIPLDFLQGAAFNEAATAYLQIMLEKSVPSTFANLKALYANAAKRDAILQIAQKLLQSDGKPAANGIKDNEGSSNQKGDYKASVHHFLAQHYNYHKTRDLAKALQHIDAAIEADPKSVEYHMTKARIWKHYGDMPKAAQTMEHARNLDTRDRYINTKAAKYQLRNDENDAALENLGKFTRNDAAGGPMADLHDMQCQWFIYEDGMANMRRGKLGLALTRLHAIYDIFEIWFEDQFDFHSFSLRKGQIRAYLDMLRWQDHLREHPYFARAAIAAAEIYLRLFDRPELADESLTNGVLDGDMDASERKKAQKKARKEAERKAREEAAKKDAAGKPPQSDGNGDEKKTKDFYTTDLIKTSDPLSQAMKFIAPLLDYAPESLEAQQTAYKVFIRRKKYLLALRSLLAVQKLAPNDPTNHFLNVHFLHSIRQTPPSLPPAAQRTLDEGLAALMPGKTEPLQLNDQYLQRHSKSAAHVQAALQVRAQILLGPDSAKEEAYNDVIRTLALETCTLKDGLKGLDLLKEWQAAQKHVDTYKAAAHERFPHASNFRATEPVK